VAGVEQRVRNYEEVSLDWKVEMVITWKHGSGKMV
jgi:hypothetical protein